MDAPTHWHEGRGTATWTWNVIAWNPGAEIWSR